MCAECPGRLARDLETGFPDLVAHHEGLVFGIALHMTRHPADAEDLAQETFLRAYRALQGYPAERVAGLRPRGWLAAIVGNLARDRARRRSPATAALDGVDGWMADDAPGPERLAVQHEAARAWQARLAVLPARYRLAVELRHIEGLSYPELSEALGRPLGTVKSDVHRGVRLLREALASEESVVAPRSTR